MRTYPTFTSPRIVAVAAIALMLLGLHSVRADDIDIYDGPGAGQAPNVLFVIDNTANWNTAFSNEMAALYNTLSALPVNSDGSARFNIGILLATETGSPNNNTSGGYIRAAIRPMTRANALLYAAMIQNFSKLKDKGNAGYSGLEMAEVYYYFSGAAPYAGNYKIKADFTGNLCSGCSLSGGETTADDAIYALSGNALASEYATSYVSPITNGCQKNFIIYISNGPNQESSSVDTLANRMLATAGGSTATIAISPAGSMSNPSDEWAQFLYKSSLGIVTDTIDVDPSSTGQGPGWTALLQSMSNVSHGKYAAVSSSAGSGADIAKQIANDLSEMQAVNGVYASVSLPVSVNTQGSYLDRVFIGMFRPDANAGPRWYGNLKQYKLDMISSSLQLADAQDSAAINSITGFITECARSFWTPTAADTYWQPYGAEGLCLSTDNTNSNYPDGNFVEKGAQAYMLRGGSSYATASDTRSLYTCPSAYPLCTSTPSGGVALTAFDSSDGALTQSEFDPTNTIPYATLINWERGRNVDSTNPGDLEYTDTHSLYAIRPSVHGDVVHSRPVAINYGTDAAPKIVVFYGGNDGVLRAINGNRDGESSIGGVAPGNELWGFIPPEFYGTIERLYNDSPQITTPAAPMTGSQPKPYGMDGPITASADATHAWVYAPMRRGGRALYAFDATNLATSGSSSVNLKWKVGCPNNFPTSGTVDDTGCSSGFSAGSNGNGIGQTWSSAKIIKTAGYSTPVVVMGGGYDTCEDADPNTCSASTTKGNEVYVLNADTGALLATLGPTDRAVSADVAIVPDLSTGLAIYAYVVDLGGNIYRITIGSSAPGSWTMTKIASLGCATVTTCSANRKFMFAPDVVLQGGVYTLLLGSGDREKPLLYTSTGSVVNSVANYFFAVQDNPTSATWLSSETTNCGSAVLCLNSLLEVTSSTAPSSTSLAAKKGWYLALNSKEQVATSALTIYGNVYFSTNQPTPTSPTSCTTNLGITRLYTISFSAPAINATILPPVGLPPSPVGGLVTLDDGTTVPFCIGCSASSPLQSTEPQASAGSVPAQPKARVYWYIKR